MLSFNQVKNADHGSASIQSLRGGVNDWNTRSTDNVNATSVNVFIKEIDKRLRRSSNIYTKKRCCRSKPKTTISICRLAVSRRTTMLLNLVTRVTRKQTQIEAPDVYSFSSYFATAQLD